MTGEIRFYDFKNKYREFSNFYLIPIKIDNEIWRSVEHYYQKMKFDNNDIIKMIKESKSPKEIYNIANSRTGKYKKFIRKDWDEIKLDVMRKALYGKFSQHAHLKKLLLDTGDAIIIENSPTDSFWGVGGFGKEAIKGQNNWLGFLLVELRDKLKGESS